MALGRLSRLRPLCRTLAFTRLFRVKRFESSPIPSKEVLVTLSSPSIRRAVFGAIPALIYREPDSRHPVLGRVYQPFHPSYLTTRQTKVSLVGIGHRVRSWVLSARITSSFVSGLHTQSLAEALRMPLNPYAITQAYLFEKLLYP